ncbi:helix-turn-helix domain-containing protein [Undibacterium sp. Xuan67W]|uniref:helix-turn-helix domain-containing protein n=1 Tax=Undibacterium sp. Xuan67W TaxID=3413057 RepID=UPI003BEF8978
MKTLGDIAGELTVARDRERISQKELISKTGLTSVTLRGLFNGITDVRVTTLIAVAEELGLELVLVPKGIARAYSSESSASEPAVETLVGATLNRPEK